jgi:GTPase SAR1 family protein
VAVTALIIVGLEWVAVILGTIAIVPKIKLPSFSSKNREQKNDAPIPNSQSPMPDTLEAQPITNSEFRLYRIAEINRTKAALLANGSILIVGEEGSGKSVMCNAVVENLLDQGFKVALIEPATPKQMLLEIASQLGVDNQSLEGKVLSADQLKRAIALHFDNETAFLAIDDAQLLDTKFRQWLKTLKRSKVPMLISATDPPRSDIFTSIPRIELAQLPEYAIREIMEQAALERGINLKNSDLAKLQERAGGNPALAQRAIEEEYLGLEVEGADHRRYADATPLILLAGVGFVVTRFFARGTNNQALYIFSGIAAAIFLGVSRVLYYLPPDDKRIR